MSLLDLIGEPRPQPPPEPEKKSGSSDIFVWLGALWTKQKLGEAPPALRGTPPVWMMHRFLASDPDMARLAQELQTQVQDPVLVFRTWQGWLPKGRAAPQLTYVAPKKLPKEEALVTRMKMVLAERRDRVESIISLLKAMGKERQLYREFGVKE